MSDLNEDDNKVLRILGLSRDELTAILAVIAILILALVYFRGCTAIGETPLGDLTGDDAIVEEADGPLDITEEATEITNVRIAYRPNFVHFDGTGADSEDVEIYVNGENVGDTQTTFAGKWSYEIKDLEPGFYEVYSEHPDLEDSRSATRVLHILENGDGGQDVRMFPAGTSIEAARSAETDGALANSDRSPLLRPAFDPALALTGLSAGAIALNGTGSPNVEHLLFVNGEQVDSTTADADGNWSFVYDQPNAGDYDISVVAIDGDSEVDSGSVLLGLAPVAIADAQEDAATEPTAVPDSDPAEEQDATPVEESTEEQTVVEEENTTEGEEEQESDAVAEEEPADVADPIYLLTVSDTNDGTSDEAVTLSGEATPGTTVNVAVDGVMVQSAPVGDDGTWSFSGIFPPGDHDVTIELFAADSAGSVVQSATSTFTVSAARDITLTNSGDNGLIQLGFGSADGDSSGETQSIASEVPAVELIVDASWSMTLPLDSNEEADRLAADDPNSRIAVAQAAMIDLIENTLPEGAPVALRAFGNIEGNLSCRTDLMSELQPLNRDNLTQIVEGITPQFDANTALGASLAQVRNDLAQTDRERVVVLLTDGQETCGRDPGIVIETLAAEGTEVQVNIIGFAIQDDELKAEFEDWAERGNGTYYDALDPDRLADALAESMTVGYLITDGEGNTVTRGVVSGRPIELEPGVYNVINSNGDVIYENIVVTSSSVNELIAR